MKKFCIPHGVRGEDAQRSGGRAEDVEAVNTGLLAELQALATVQRRSGHGGCSCAAASGKAKQEQKQKGGEASINSTWQ